MPTFNDLLPQKTEEYRPSELAQLFDVYGNKLGFIENDKSVKLLMASDNKEYKYKAYFNNIELKACTENTENIALASVEELKPFLPKINFDLDYDIVGFTANAANPNICNRNNQVIGGFSGLKIAPTFKNRFVNLEHNRQIMLGFISDYGFSSFGDDEPLTEEQVIELCNQNKPYNIVISGFLWRLADPVVDVIEKNKDKFSLSWEVAFMDYVIARGEGLLANCEIINDAEEIARLTPMLKTFGGKGLDDDGRSINLLISSEDSRALGVGVVQNPAAFVSGLLVSDEELEIKEMCEEMDEVEAKLDISDEISEENEKIINNNEKIIENEILETVKENILTSNFNMKIKNIKDINNEVLKEMVASENGASVLQDFLTESLDEAAAQWKEKLDAEQAIVAEAQKELNSTKEIVEQLKKELDEIKADAAARANEEIFQNRMSSINDEYELDDEARASVAEDIRDLDEEAFTAWAKRFEKYAKSMKKNKEVKASEETVVEEVKEEVVEIAASLETATVVDPVIPNSVTVKEDNVSKYVNALANSTKIQFNK